MVREASRREEHPYGEVAALVALDHDVVVSERRQLRPAHPTGSLQHLHDLPVRVKGPELIPVRLGLVVEPGPRGDLRRPQLRARVDHHLGHGGIEPLEEIVGQFRIEDVGASPARFDLEKLTWMNGEYIRALPNDELYFDLKPNSSNLGRLDQNRLIAGLPQESQPNAPGTYQLFRIGDAVSSRNIHAAIYDALRLVKDL